MNEGDYAFDFQRIFFGNRPWLFLVEVLLRTAIMYVFALLVVRILGKRGMGQLAPFDFVIIIALGSAVGDPMFYSGVPLLHAMVAIAAIIFFTRRLVHVTERSPRVKEFVSTTPTRLVVDGMMDLKGMHEEGVSRSELFETLRTMGVSQLGEVERAYLEPSGKISTFQYRPADVRPGLGLIPAQDAAAPKALCDADVAPDAGTRACCQCGQTREVDPGSVLGRCPRCDGREWVPAVRRGSELLAPTSHEEPDMRVNSPGA